LIPLQADAPCRNGSIMLQSAFAYFQMGPKTDPTLAEENFLVFLNFRSVFSAVLMTLVLVLASLGQTDPAPKTTPTPKPTPQPTTKAGQQLATADQVIESAIYVYGFAGGRNTLNQIRKTTFERGRSTITHVDGKVEQANYQRFIIRAASLWKEKIRLDQELPTARYSLVYNDGKIYGIFQNSVFVPREDVAKGFENQIARGPEALLRYKENESKIELATREKLLGVDYYVVDVTDKQDRKTRFYISAKSFRIMMLTYEDAGVKYRRKFYDYNYAQGTLVAFRSVLWTNDKLSEETDVGTVTFGQKVDEELFKVD
jgi:hypothetical protein